MTQVNIGKVSLKPQAPRMMMGCLIIVCSWAKGMDIGKREELQFWKIRHMARLAELEIARFARTAIDCMTSVSSDVPTHGNYHNYHGYILRFIIPYL